MTRTSYGNGGLLNTFSDQRGGGVSYFTADLGYNFLNSPRYRIGAFVGNNFWHESYDAFGCTQQATNWGTCVPTVPPTSTSSARTTIGIRCDSAWPGRRNSPSDSAFLVTWRSSSRGSTAKISTTCAPRSS